MTPLVAGDASVSAATPAWLPPRATHATQLRVIRLIAELAGLTEPATALARSPQWTSGQRGRHSRMAGRATAQSPLAHPDDREDRARESGVSGHLSRENCA